MEVVKIGHPALRHKTQPVEKSRLADARFRALIPAMIRTMRRCHGVGLAANQVGLGIRVAVLECVSNPRYPEAEAFPLEVWINPAIVEKSRKKVSDWEGCLSIPGYRGQVPRHEWVVLKAMTPEGRRVRRRFSGFHARVIQHEVDHLNGFFYMDRMPDLKSWVHLDAFPHLLQQEDAE